MASAPAIPIPALFHASWHTKAVRDVADVERSGADLHRGGRHRGRAAAGAAGVIADPV